MTEKEFDQKTTKWINQNRSLLKNYEGQYIVLALDENENVVIIANSEMPKDVIERARENGHDYTIYKVPNKVDAIHVYPIRVRKAEYSCWEPMYNVKLFHSDSSYSYVKVKMLVDSGADITVISYKKGLELGFQLDQAEIKEQIEGICGFLSAVKRFLKIDIDGYVFDIPIVWVLEAEPELILGREVVFDKFDIEFKQADKKIIFKYRK